MDIQKIRKLFPSAKKWTYMNHAAVSPLSTRVVDAMTAFLGDQLQNGLVYEPAWETTQQNARALVGRLLNARSDEIAFVKNTSEGISFIANGLPLRARDTIAVVEGEFPSNLYPWIALANRGVKLAWIPERNGRIDLADVRKVLRRRPIALAISFVEYLSGFRNDMIEIGKMCEEFDVFYFVDGIQGLGALPLDVRAARIDALASDSKKWLMGPQGAAFLYCSRRVLDQIRVTEHGWLSVKDPFVFRGGEIRYLGNAGRFEPGSLNTVGIYGLAAALELLHDVGIAEISARLLSLTDRLCDGLESRGYRLLSSRRDGEKSGIVSFAHPKRRSEAIVKMLNEHSVIAATRGGHVRLSPHYYLLESDIDKVVGLLA